MQVSKTSTGTIVSHTAVTSSVITLIGFQSFLAPPPVVKIERSIVTHRDSSEGGSAIEKFAMEERFGGHSAVECDSPPQQDDQSMV